MGLARPHLHMCWWVGRTGTTTFDCVSDMEGVEEKRPRTCEEIRLEKGRAYCKYLNEPIGPMKIHWLGVYKSLCLMYEDAYEQEIKGNPVIHDSSKIGSKERQLVPIEEEEAND